MDDFDVCVMGKFSCPVKDKMLQKYETVDEATESELKVRNS